MSQTFLTHLYKNCGGSVVIDASPSAKLIAPSFCINSHGITNLTLDINISNGGNLIPEFLCTKCGVTIEKNSIGTHLSATCQVCSRPYEVDTLEVHKYISCICKNCILEIKSYVNGEPCSNSRIVEYIESFSITSNFNTISLKTVLNSPIRI